MKAQLEIYLKMIHLLKMGCLILTHVDEWELHLNPELAEE